MVKIRFRRMTEVLAMAALLQTSVACGSGESSSPGEAPGSTPPVVAAASQVDAAAVSGLYEVSGVTVQANSGRQRQISGTLELDVTGEQYTVRFELATTAPHASRALPATVRGTGSGFIVGGIFAGTTEERLDIPERDSPLEELAVVSTSQASFDEQGVFRIQLQNYPGVGQAYSPSVTVLAGRRVEDLPAD